MACHPIFLFYSFIYCRFTCKVWGGDMQKVWLISIEKILIFACTYLLTTDYRFTRISSLA